MKIIALCVVALSLSAQAANTFDLGVVPASDSLQAKLESLLQTQFEQEEHNAVEAASRTVKRTAAGAYLLAGSNGTLECQEYSPSGEVIGIQIQTYGCKIELK
jgi:hypothetical protein